MTTLVSAPSSIGRYHARSRLGTGRHPALATLTITGQIVAGTSFDPERIAERYWEVVHTDDSWQAEFRFTGE